jgi:hypothetical protein
MNVQHVLDITFCFFKQSLRNPDLEAGEEQRMLHVEFFTDNMQANVPLRACLDGHI